MDQFPKRRSAPMATQQAQQKNRRAAWLAWRIEEDIHADGWPLGTVYGSQSGLRRRYGTGDESLHEAIRLLEFNGVARMRPGRGGGLIVERPSLHLVIAAVVGYFRVVRTDPKAAATLAQVKAARASLVAVAVQTACERVAKDGKGEFVARLRHLLKPETATVDLPVLLAVALEDPCLQLCAYCLNSLGHAFIEAEGEGGAVVEPELLPEATQEILDAIFAGNSAIATQWANRLTLQHPAGWLVEHGVVHDPFASRDSPLNRSRVGQLVRRIATDLRHAHIAEQRRLGSEAALLERYSTARSTLRQALRVLEDARLITARRGRGHGWFACIPNRDLPVRQIRNYLAGCQVTPVRAREFVERWRIAAHADETRADQLAAKGTNAVLDLLLQGVQAHAEAVVRLPKTVAA